MCHRTVDLPPEHKWCVKSKSCCPACWRRLWQNRHKTQVKTRPHPHNLLQLRCQTFPRIGGCLCLRWKLTSTLTGLGSETFGDATLHERSHRNKTCWILKPLSSRWFALLEMKSHFLPSFCSSVLHVLMHLVLCFGVFPEAEWLVCSLFFISG